MNTTHPKGLYFLFLTEMWERFSYYGITAILILYMDKTFAIDKNAVYAIYGAYGALIYTTPLLGGLIADRFWGSYKTVVVGTWLIALGHFVVAVRDPNLVYFYLGLAIIIVGTGLFSPNINTLVGLLYDKEDARRDSGFTLAYMGRNIGTIIAPIVCAWLAASYDWHWAFIVAGFGMLVGLWTFRCGKPHFNPASFVPASGRFVKRENLVSVFNPLAILTGVLSVELIYVLLNHVDWVGKFLALAISTTVFLLMTFLKSQGSQVRKDVGLAMLLTLFYIIFMILLQQSGGALNLFTDTNVNRQIGSWTIETGMFQSVEPLALVLLSPLYGVLWQALAKRQIHLSDGLKFSLALFIMASSFLVMACAMGFTDPEGKIAMSWLNATYVLQAASELFIGPIGLAMITRLVPNKIVGLFFGFWVMGSAIANFVAAKIGAWMTPASAQFAHSQLALEAYQGAFLRLAALGIGAALILSVLLPWVGRTLKTR